MKEAYMAATNLARPFFFVLLLASTAFLLQAASGAGSEWTTPGGTLEGTRFSTLAQITDQNVAGLIEEFNLSTGSNGYREGQPLVVNNTMYVVGPFPTACSLLTLPSRGKTRWVFTPQVSQFAMGQACCGISSRGAAYSGSSSNTSGKNLVIYSTLDNQVIAVDAASGSRVWRTSMGSPHTGQTMTGAAFVINSNGTDIVIVGNAGAELGVRGWVAALNARCRLRKVTLGHFRLRKTADHRGILRFEL
jgi:alcohol dehydrogenase (cytochrome c)